MSAYALSWTRASRSRSPSRYGPISWRLLADHLEQTGAGDRCSHRGGRAPGAATCRLSSAPWGPRSSPDGRSCPASPSHRPSRRWAAGFRCSRILDRSRPFVIVATAQVGAATRRPAAKEMEVLTLEKRQRDLSRRLRAALVDIGYERNYMVERGGEFAVRGGILDVFPPGADRPVRAEFWGDEISSLGVSRWRRRRSLEEVDGDRQVASRRELTDGRVDTSSGPRS